MDQYVEVTGARQHFKCISINWEASETLKIDSDYPDWERTIFNFKLKIDPNITNHVVTYAFALWAGLHFGLQESLELNIEKTAGDHALPSAMFMSVFFKKA